MAEQQLKRVLGTSFSVAACVGYIIGLIIVQAEKDGLALEYLWQDSTHGARLGLPTLMAGTILLGILGSVLVQVPEAALIALPGIKAFRRLTQSALALADGKLRLYRGYDGKGDLILHGKYIFQVAVIALGPDVIVLRRIDELRGDPHSIPGAPNAAFNDVSHAQS